VKKILTLAILLLTLLPVTESMAQSYSSEATLGELVRNAWNNAQNSNADIYSEVYDENYSNDIDYYSQYGDFTYEVVSGYDLTPYDISSQGSSSTGASSWTENNNSSLAVGYSLTRVDGKYLKDNIWYRTISYTPPSGVTMCTTIPQYYPFYQTVDYECVLCASGTIANIMGYDSGLYSDYGNYIDTYRKMYRYTQEELKINLYEQMPNGDPVYYYNMIHNIGGVPVNMTSASDVQTYLDNGSAVLGVWTSPSNYVELNPSVNSHMVTIVGYDGSNY